MESSNWPKIVGLVILTIIVSFATVKYTGSAPSALGNKVYDRIVSSGMIKVCYVITPPSLIKDPNTGELSGVSYEVLEQAAKNLGLKLSWDYEVGWGEMIEALNSDKCDIVGSALWGNSNRGKTADMTIPLFYSAINAYVRASDFRFDGDLKIVNSEQYTLATIDGTTPQLIATRQFPNARTLDLPQNSDASLLLVNVTSGKADMTFVEAATARLYDKNNPNKLRAVANVKPVAVYEDVMLVKKGEYQLKTTIDGALKELLYGGYVDDVIDKYEKKYPGGFYRIATPYVISQ